MIIPNFNIITRHLFSRSDSFCTFIKVHISLLQNNKSYKNETLQQCLLQISMVYIFKLKKPMTRNYLFLKIVFILIRFAIKTFF